MALKRKKPKYGVYEAAGGLLWRRQAGVNQLAVIHRRVYGDWSLPKGMRKKKETFHQAALREVYEETGCRARLLSLAGSISYMAFGWPKIVVYWHMLLLEDRDFETNDEVDALQWLEVDRALELLSHENERILLDRNRDFWQNDLP